jgi:hypothetical protein
MVSCYEIEMNVQRSKEITIPRQPAPLQIDTLQTTGKCGVFQLFGYCNNKWYKMNM